ncbi:hypothetical protein KIPE111705_25690 [Kibdelosporangium persicum]|uniref:Uncharacterized protein n=1 Tax=Kibdelosporangium persicum TaxID=2698649 RepID=A0ABX2FGS3_9PSEU|nr:hypothetical protein [Kibdelosporangium persicum]
MAIIAIVVGGLIVVGGGLTWMIIWLNRSNAEAEQDVLGRLRAEAPRLGWRYEERADQYTQVYDDVERYPKLSEPIVGFAASPKALEAHDVVTGEHRGRPFLAARFWVDKPMDTRGPGGPRPEYAIWVRTPAPRPTLDVRAVPKLQSAVGSATGTGDLKIGHREFDARYQVTAENADFARAVLSPQLVDFLLTDPRPFDGFWMRGGQLEVVRDVVNDHRDPGPLLAALDLRCDILDRIPPQVWASS